MKVTVEPINEGVATRNTTAASKGTEKLSNKKGQTYMKDAILATSTAMCDKVSKYSCDSTVKYPDLTGSNTGVQIWHFFLTNCS